MLNAGNDSSWEGDDESCEKQAEGQHNNIIVRHLCLSFGYIPVLVFQGLQIAVFSRNEEGRNGCALELWRKIQRVGNLF